MARESEVLKRLPSGKQHILFRIPEVEAAKSFEDHDRDYHRRACGVRLHIQLCDVSEDARLESPERFEALIGS